MGHSVGDGLIVASLAAALVAYMYFKYAERRRRLELVHQERLAAMDKGIPLPEIPIDPPRHPRPRDPRAALIHGIVWLSLGLGAMGALRLVGLPEGPRLWPLPLPLALLGVGMLLFYALGSERAR
jgi:hypothetical protein